MPLNGLNETLERQAATYQSQLDAALTAHHGVSDYLRSRELAYGSLIAQFRLGYVAEPLPGDEAFRGRLAIPYLTPAGVRAIKFRCVQAHDCKAVGRGHAKYAQPDGQKQRLYNVQAYHDAGDVLGVADGEIDAQSATVHLDLPTIGVPGATQWDKHGAYWKLALTNFLTVIIFVDGDKPRCMCQPRHADNCPSPKRAGLELAKKIAGDAPNGVGRIVRLPDGEDVNSMVVAGRVDELRQKAGI